MSALLCRHGLPFAVCLASTGAERDAYRSALIAGHAAGGDARPFAVVVLAGVRSGWAALEREPFLEEV